MLRLVLLKMNAFVVGPLIIISTMVRTHLTYINRALADINRSKADSITKS